MIDLSMSGGLSRRKTVNSAARIANHCAAIHKQFESSLRDALRIALADTRLVYVESEYASLVHACVAKALAAAFDGESEADIAVAIEETFSDAIDARLRQLGEPSPPEE